MPTKTSNNKSAWSAKDIYDMIFSTYGNAHVNANKARAKEASKYMIPYILEKEIMLTTGRYNTGKISTNLLDSIYNASQRTGVPLDIALWLAGRESTLGIGRGFKKGKSVSGTDLYSNWQQIQTIPNNKAQMKRWNSLLGRTDLTDEDYDFKSEFLMRAQDSLENTKPLDENPIDNALKFYQTGKYNPGDSRHTQMVEDDAKALMSDPAIQKWLKTKTGTQMKCGGRRKAQLGLDIREGGIAIPIANNMWYIHGRKHEYGGVTMGPNNKNGVEVEGGEVVEMIDSNHPSVGRQFKAGGQQQTMRVFSSVPLLRGVSPAQLVMGGANPNKVFKAQEEFKDRNRINDDGTHYEMGGEGKPKSKRSRPVTGVLPYGYTIRNLYAVENPYRKGIKGNVAKMYDNRTLGAGVDVVSGHPELYKKAKSGKITKKQADETAVIHLRKDDNAIRSNYADVYGKAAADTLSYGPRFLVAQARYQQGNVRKAWQPIHEAMAKGDAKALKKAVLQVTPKDHEYRRKWIEDFKVYKMGGMIYEINGNVKNGLMASRPKAKYGKIDRKNKDVKVGQDGLIYKRAANGEWYTDGTKHITSKPIVKSSREDLILANDKAGYVWPNSDGTFLLIETIAPEQAKVISRKFDKPKRTHVSGYAYEDEEKETKKIGSLTYEKNEDGQWVPASKQSISTTRDGGRPKDFGMTRTGVNHPNGSYKYHPLTGEKISEIGVVETSEPSVKGTTKVSGQPISTPRKGGTQSTAGSRGTAKVESPKPTTATNPMEARYASRVQQGQAQEVTTQPVVEYNETADKNPDKNRYTRATGFKAGEAPASPGNNQKAKDDEKDKDERLIPQFKPINTGDWIGLGSNLAGHIASYFINNNLLDKYPMPTKPALFQAAKLKTTHNINPKLATSREIEQMNLAEVGRNTSSSSTSIARKQRIMNEARDARNKLYGEKENIETQLINLDRRNRQDVFNRNIAAVNDWLDKTYIAKSNNLLNKQRNLTNLISGIPMAVNTMLGTIESRKSTNDMIQAISSSRPNVDGRLLGIGDYYSQKLPDGRTAIYNKNHKLVKYV